MRRYKMASLAVAAVSLIGYQTQAAPVAPAGVIGAPPAHSSRTEVVASVTASTATAIQTILKSYGYTIVIDGVYGPQTTRAVRSWQRSNGLFVDGIAGPVTLRSLGLGGVPGDSGNPKIAPQPSSAPQAASPGAPGDCASWLELTRRYGLPDEFVTTVGWRESRCTHVVADRPSTRDLSVGLFQVNWYGNLRSMWERAGWSWSTMRDDPEAAIAAAGALYKMCGGTGPWTPPYSCAGNDLPTPSEMGYGS